MYYIFIITADLWKGEDCCTMKIICNKEYNARELLQYIAEYVEKRYPKFPIAENMQIEISLKNLEGESCSENKSIISLEDMDLSMEIDKAIENYYNRDVLTGLYNRHKFEKDIHMFQEIGYSSMVCVYIDAVGLHEINNHLGHNAGDHMLCVISEEMQNHFMDSLTYRIGGDEFLILCPGQEKREVKQKSKLLKEAIREYGYEISLGVCESRDRKKLKDAIDCAENAMRHDKMKFYQKHGGLRQMRSLNYELEKLLIEKQDASHFLNVIAPQYKGVYIVNSKTDTCRFIYVPPYFQKMLDEHQGRFSPSMRDYYKTLVCPQYYSLFEEVFHYDSIKEKLASGKEIEFTYEKLDGSFIELKITTYMQEFSNIKEMLWIFREKEKNE